MSTEVASVAVVIVAFDNAEMIEDLVRSVQPRPEVVEVVVVDHGGDGSADVAARAGATVRLDPANPGFGAGQNAGRELTDAPFVLILNPDAELDPSALRSGLDFLAAHPSTGAVQGIIENSVTGLPERSAGDELGWMHLVGRAVGARALLGRPWVRRVTSRTGRFRDHVERVPDRPVEVDTLAATAILARREALDSVGGFDERYFLYGEDLDLCRRLRAAGWAIFTLPVPWARHRSGASSGSWWDRERWWWQGTMRFAACNWSAGAFAGALAAAAVQWTRMLVERPGAWRDAGRSLLVEPVRERGRGRRAGVR